MANNVNIPAQGTGDTTPKVSTDQVTADQSQVQNFQLTTVSGGVLTRNPTLPVSAVSLPLPTGAALDATLTANGVLTGAVNETAPGTDTANSGLNGRLQRIAQRLTSLLALLPASLGQKTSAASLAVTIASDQSALTVAAHAVTNAGTFAVQADTELPTAAALGDTDANPTAPQVGAALQGWTGSVWVRLKAGIGDAASATGLLNLVPMMFNGTTYDRLRGDSTNGLKVNGSGVTQPVSAASLPLPAGAATSAKQPALGTSAAPSVDVLSAVVPDLSTTGSVTSATNLASITTLNGHSTVTVQVTSAGTTCTITYEGTVDGSTWAAVSGQLVGGTGVLVTTSTTTGLWQFDVAGLVGFRARVSTYTSGTVAGAMRASYADSAIALDLPLPAGANIIGALTANQSTNVAQVGGTATDTNSGNKSAGTQRVVLATDQPQLTNALKVDGSAVTQPVSGTISVSGTMPTNQTQIAGTAIDVNSGTKSAGTQRFVIATDQPNLTTPLNANVAQINGVTPLMGAGNTGTGSPRVTIATDQVTIPVTAASQHSATVTQTTVACSASSVTLLSANTAAKQRTIVNDSTSAGYLRFNASAATNANFTIKMQAGQTYEFAPILYDGEIRAISDTATGNWRISEWT